MADVLRRLHAEMGNVQVRCVEVPGQNWDKEVPKGPPLWPPCEQSCHLCIEEGACASCEGVEKAAPGRRTVEEKKKVSPSFIDPAPKINLVEAHLNRPSLQAKGTKSPP
jgi:hypothetical protein